tara:strand:+ start:26248 stop:26442 length:195 start_codon:yes stop_codon:yes gene_type:complete
MNPYKDNEIATAPSWEVLTDYGTFNRLIRVDPESAEKYRDRRNKLYIELLRRLREYDYMVEDTS